MPVALNIHRKNQNEGDENMTKKQIKIEGKFEYKIMSENRRPIQTPKGFKEEDMRHYSICGMEDLIELMNHAVDGFNREKDNEGWCSTGDGLAHITYSDGLIEANFYRLERSFLKEVSDVTK